MADNRFRKAVTLFRYLLALMACSLWLQAIAHDDAEAEFFDAIRAKAVEQICADQHFLETAQLETGVCAEAVGVHVEKCWAIVEPLEPEVNLDDSDFSDETTRKFRSLGAVYLMCLQSKILLSKSGGN